EFLIVVGPAGEFSFMGADAVHAEFATNSFAYDHLLESLELGTEARAAFEPQVPPTVAKADAEHGPFAGDGGFPGLVVDRQGARITVSGQTGRANPNYLITGRAIRGLYTVFNADYRLRGKRGKTPARFGVQVCPFHGRHLSFIAAADVS